jgi:hypothetical protein
VDKRRPLLFSNTAAGKANWMRFSRCISDNRGLGWVCKQIWEWVRKFCEATGATGQLCFDFIRDETEGRMLPIECNPRTSTIFLNFYNHPAAAEAFYSAKVRMSVYITCLVGKL